MTLNLHAITFDCSNALELGRFWSAALGRPLDNDDNSPNEFFASIGRSNPSADQITLMFIQVPEGKVAKNRVHLDLEASDRDTEVARLVSLGASIIHDKDEWGVRWTTMADPEGNEFCLAMHG